jgi:hypothetical protein
MKKLMTILIAGTAALILPLSLACAQQNDGYSNILNGQVDLQSQVAKVNTQVTNVFGNLDSSAAAIGNNVSIFTMNNTNVDNNQIVGPGADIVAIQNADVNNVGGTTTLSATAECNSADVSTDPSYTNVNNQQECDATDPYAALNANVNTAGNDVSLAATAVGNSFSEDTNAPSSNINNLQINNSFEEAVVNSTVSNVYGNVAINAQAIGNNAQIIHY